MVVAPDWESRICLAGFQLTIDNLSDQFLGQDFFISEFRGSGFPDIPNSELRTFGDPKTRISRTSGIPKI